MASPFSTFLNVTIRAVVTPNYQGHSPNLCRVNKDIPMQDEGFKGINFYEDELNNFREHPNVADVPILVTALEHAYEVLTTHEAIIKIFCTVFEKMEDYYRARLELGEALRTIENVTWEACIFIQIVREREGQKGHTPDSDGAPTDRGD